MSDAQDFSHDALQEATYKSAVRFFHGSKRVILRYCSIVAFILGLACQLRLSPPEADLMTEKGKVPTVASTFAIETKQRDGCLGILFPSAGWATC